MCCQLGVVIFSVIYQIKLIIVVCIVLLLSCAANYYCCGSFPQPFLSKKSLCLEEVHLSHADFFFKHNPLLADFSFKRCPSLLTGTSVLISLFIKIKDNSLRLLILNAAL